MKNEGAREAGKCSKVLPDHGDRCLFIFLWSRRLFFNVFLFPVCIAQLIGDWYENGCGARNTIIFLIIRQYYWRTNAPCANSNSGPNMKKNPRNIIGLSCLVNIACWRRGTSVRQYIGADAPCDNGISALKKKQPARQQCWCNKFHIAYWRTEPKENLKRGARTVRCTSPIFIPIAY